MLFVSFCANTSRGSVLVALTLSLHTLPLYLSSTLKEVWDTLMLMIPKSVFSAQLMFEQLKFPWLFPHGYDRVARVQQSSFQEAGRGSQKEVAVSRIGKPSFS